jgi:hypothetical protein
MFHARSKKQQPKVRPSWREQLDSAPPKPAPDTAGSSNGVKRTRDDDPEPLAAEAVRPEDDDDDDDVDLSRYQLEDDDEEEEIAQPTRSTQLWVTIGNLAFETTNATLAKFLEECGIVQKIELPAANRLGREGQALFSSDEEVDRALAKNNCKLDGRRVTVVRQTRQGTEWAGRAPDDDLATYGYSKEKKSGNKFFGTVFADDDARSLEKLQKLEHKRVGRGAGGPRHPALGRLDAHRAAQPTSGFFK